MSAHAFGPALQARIDAGEWNYPSARGALRALRDDPRGPETVFADFVKWQMRQGPLWMQIIEDRLLETARATVVELLAKAEERELHAHRAVASETVASPSVGEQMPERSGATQPGVYVDELGSVLIRPVASAKPSAAPAPLQLQVGHRYKARDGGVWDCIGDRGEHLATVARFKVCRPGYESSRSASGRCYSYSDHPFDFVEDLGPTPRPTGDDHG